MSLQIGYLNARDAAALDADLMSTPGFSLEQLMELAGLAVAEAVYQVSAENDGRERKKRVLVVCGPGNNGGDGLVAARHLVHFGLDCTIVYPKPSSKPHFVNLVKQCQDMNIHVLPAMPSEENLDQNKYDIIVDAIFGFSFDSKSTIREPFATVISKMIQLQKEQNATLISVDVPSGWDVDGGDLTGLNFHPDVLISLTAPKMSANKFEGRHFVGGRFLPPAIAEKYGVQMYPYPGLRHCMEVTFVLGSSAESPKDSRFKAEVMEEGDWAVQYQTYLDSAEAYVKEQETHVKEASVRKVLEGEDWALQYAQYCMEKENKFLSSYQNKN